MGFDRILDQHVPVRLLRNILASQRVPNGLLFWGPSGVGKRLTAIELAKAINCNAAEADACGQCLSCRKIDHGNHPDVHVTVPVKKSRIINVGAVEQIVELAVLRPFEGAWRVFILHDAERMAGPGQNKLLKTLEEPPGQTLFILLTEHPRMLLPTIRSRCQSVRFGGLSPETVQSLLMRERDIDERTATSIAAVAQGQMSRALELVDSEKREIVFDFLRRLSAGENPLSVSEEFGKYLASEKAAIESTLKSQNEPVDTAEWSKEDRERMKEEQQAVADALSRRGILELLYLIETWYRDKMVYRATQDGDRVLNRDQLTDLGSTDEENFDEKLGAIEKARVYLERFLNEERVFRDLFFTLAR